MRHVGWAKWNNQKGSGYPTSFTSSIDLAFSKPKLRSRALRICVGEARAKGAKGALAREE